jgi:hypothetical protein
MSGWTPQLFFLLLSFPPPVLSGQHRWSPTPLLHHAAASSPPPPRALPTLPAPLQSQRRTWPCLCVVPTPRSGTAGRGRGRGELASRRQTPEPECGSAVAGIVEVGRRSMQVEAEWPDPSLWQCSRSAMSPHLGGARVALESSSPEESWRRRGLTAVEVGPSGAATRPH